MNLDIRLPLGLMFTAIGALLAAYGALEPARSQALGHDVNLIWGLCIAGFGAAMLASWKLLPGRRSEPGGAAPDEPPAPRKSGPPPS